MNHRNLYYHFKRRQFVYRVLVAWMAYIGFCAPCSAQLHRYSHVAGKVVDKKTKIPIAGASVIVKEMKLGDATDLTGLYEIVLPAGMYTIVISHPRYLSQIRDSVVTTDGRKTICNVSLVPRFIDTLFWKGKAERDIAAGDVHIFTCERDMKTPHSRLFDAILRKYGFSYRNNCKDPMDALRIYNNVVYRYLEIRNGHNWESKLYDDLRKFSQKMR